MNYKLIGIGGVAQCGKDSLFKALSILNPNFIRHSFGDKVKEDLRPVLMAQYGVDIFNCSPKEKEICREVIVTYANLRRDETNGLHWINEAESAVKKSIELNLIPVLTDVRYENEAKWIQSLGGIVVHLTKYSVKDGEKIYHPPANEVEAKNDPLLQAVANIKTEWENNLPHSSRITFAENLLKQL